jgi:diacylglycerol kinase (ATP)
LVLAVPAAFWLGESGVERALMIGSVLVALVVELVNAAIEAAVDRISLEDHRLAKRAKDIGSAAVMVSLANAAVVWALVILD